MRELITLPADVSRTRAAEFKVGIRSLPYLADHGFQDMVVLPGSFYIEMALQVHRELHKETPGTLRNVRFRNPVILSYEDTIIKIKVGENGDEALDYMFFGSGPDQNHTPYFAGIEIDSARAGTRGKPANEFSIAEFKARGTSVTSAEEFYANLRESGNQYGPRFQNLAAIWRSGDQALGRLSVPNDDQPQANPHYLHPTLIDSITQLLAAFIIENGRTFILESIDRIEIRDANFPETLWARATRRGGYDDAAGLVGDIDVFDESGKHYLELTGVAFTFLDRIDASGVETANQLDLCIASTFTAEPLEDSLEFWGDRFGVPTEVQFAPNNQIFQQLLDTSTFHNNSDGVNAILLGLEDWTEKDQQAGLKADVERTERCFANRSRYVLPNGLEIVHLNQYETDYTYQEIFHDQCYLQHGIHINDGDTVIDIGANIGLFSLFVMSRCRNPAIYAFEPSPVVFDLLKTNCEAYGPKVHAFNRGVSDSRGTAEFTFYEKSSVFSSFHPDASEDREAIEAIVRNVLSSETRVGKESIEDCIRELTAERLRRQTYQCQLTSVSEIIRQNALKRIDLLKIDAEKSEVDILNGIDDRHWPLIDQIVIEVHDRTNFGARPISSTGS